MDTATVMAFLGICGWIVTLGVLLYGSLGRCRYLPSFLFPPRVCLILFFVGIVVLLIPILLYWISTNVCFDTWLMDIHRYVLYSVVVYFGGVQFVIGLRVVLLLRGKFEERREFRGRHT